MSAHRQLVQELLALAICGGSHQLVLSVGDDRWSLPVVDGRGDRLPAPPTSGCTIRSSPRSWR